MTKTIVRLMTAKKTDNQGIKYRLMVNSHSLTLTGPLLPTKELIQDIERLINKCKRCDFDGLENTTALSRNMLIQLLTSDSVELNPLYYLSSTPLISMELIEELKIGRLTVILTSYNIEDVYEFIQYLDVEESLQLLNEALFDSYHRFIEFWIHRPIRLYDSLKFRHITFHFLGYRYITKFPNLHELLLVKKDELGLSLNQNDYPDIYEALTLGSVPLFHDYIRQSTHYQIRGQLQTLILNTFEAEFRHFLRKYLDKYQFRNPGITQKVIAHDLFLYPKQNMHVGKYSYQAYPNPLNTNMKKLIDKELLPYFEKRAAYVNSIGQNFWLITQKDPIYKEVIIDFSPISSVYRIDIQSYLKERLNVREPGPQLAARFNRLRTVLSELVILVGPKHIVEITKADVISLIRVLETATKPTGKKKYSINSIRQCITEMRLVFDCVTHDQLYKVNPFRSYVFRHSKSHSTPIKSIPKSVIEQLSCQLPQHNRPLSLLWQIMMWTGSRAGEVTNLTTKSLMFDEELSHYYLNFKLEKTKKALSKKGLSNSHPLPIPKELALIIQTFIQETHDIRQSSQTDYLFLQKKYSIHLKPSYERMSTSSINNGINQIIANCHIVDLDGNLWKFSTHQCRKTLATELLSLGHSYHEVGAILGHTDSKTTKAYYHDVHLQKIALLDQELFKMFNVDTLKQQTNSLAIREANLLKEHLVCSSSITALSRDGQGSCARPTELSPCQQINCVMCPLFITGPEKLSSWQQLVLQQQLILTDLHHQLGIDYATSPLYIEQLNLFKTYQDVVEKIVLFSEKG